MRIYVPHLKREINPVCGTGDNQEKPFKPRIRTDSKHGQKAEVRNLRS